MALEYKDYYAILGVPRTASEEEIKKAFRRLARQHHPDVAKDPRSEERFKEINEAYEVLGNLENRRQYDALGPGWKSGARFRPPPGAARRPRTRRSSGEAGEDFEFQFGGTGFSEFFEALFGGRARGGFRGFEGFGRGEEERGSGGQRGGDVESDLLVTLDEVLRGSVRTITLQRVDPRDGRTERTSFQARLPAGVGEGQRIRIAGKGEPGPGGPGDLFLRVRLAKHPDFRVRERDLVIDLVLAPWEAVLGATVSVPTLEGSVAVRVPAGSRAGHQLRVRGKGLPTPGGDRGDLYVAISIDVPSAPGAEEKAAWERLASVSKFRPREGAS